MTMHSSMVPTPGNHPKVVGYGREQDFVGHIPLHIWPDTEGLPLRHADYPHEPGQLYDCPACEAQCFCGNRTPPGGNPACCGLAPCLPGCCHTECVHCAIADEGTSNIDEETITPRSEWTP